MRLLVTALVLAALALVGCGHDKAFKESPEQVAKEQAAADAHNADTVPGSGDDETPSTDGVASGTTTTAVPLYAGVQALRVGDCVDIPARNTSSVRTVPCDRPHHEEVTARVDVGPRFPNGAPTPADFDRIERTDCQQAFDAYVRQPPPPGVELGGFEITPEAWYMGDHVVICTVRADREGNVLTGSVRKAV
jgi:hypothetical protein